MDVFCSSGKNPTASAATKGGVSRVYERPIKGYAYALDAGAKLQLPRDASKGLGLLQPFLALQVKHHGLWRHPRLLPGLSRLERERGGERERERDPVICQVCFCLEKAAAARL